MCEIELIGGFNLSRVAQSESPVAVKACSSCFCFRFASLLSFEHCTPEEAFVILDIDMNGVFTTAELMKLSKEHLKRVYKYVIAPYKNHKKIIFVFYHY